MFLLTVTRMFTIYLRSFEASWATSRFPGIIYGFSFLFIFCLLYFIYSKVILPRKMSSFSLVNFRIKLMADLKRNTKTIHWILVLLCYYHFCRTFFTLQGCSWNIYSTLYIYIYIGKIRITVKMPARGLSHPRRTLKLGRLWLPVHIAYVYIHIWCILANGINMVVDRLEHGWAGQLEHGYWHAGLNMVELASLTVLSTCLFTDACWNRLSMAWWTNVVGTIINQ